MAWLGTWKYRRKITVDNTNVDSDLPHFPVPIVLGDSVGQSSQDLSSIFDELTSDANRFKIAITKDDGTTQIYGDIETWDDANEKAVIHVAKSDLGITTATVTELYIYYDSAQSDNTTYISDSGGTAAQSVWDDNFVAVYHMAQDPAGGADCMLDSTDNLHITPSGTMLTADLVDGEIGKAIDFDGTDDGMTGTHDALYNIKYVTLEVTSYNRTLGLFAGGVAKGDIFGGNNGYEYKIDFHDGNANFKRSGYGATEESGNVAITQNDWQNWTGVNDGTNIMLYKDGVLRQSGTDSITTLPATTKDFKMGENLAGNYSYDGLFQEVRISDIARSAPWIKATNYALTDNLLTFGSEETPTEDLPIEFFKHIRTNHTNLRR